jgi:hypothetical protein
VPTGASPQGLVVSTNGDHFLTSYAEYPDDTVTVLGGDGSFALVAPTAERPVRRTVIRLAAFEARTIWLAPFPKAAAADPGRDGNIDWVVAGPDDPQFVSAVIVLRGLGDGTVPLPEVNLDVRFWLTAHSLQQM